MKVSVCLISFDTRLCDLFLFAVLALDTGPESRDLNRQSTALCCDVGGRSAGCQPAIQQINNLRYGVERIDAVPEFGLK